MIKPIILFTGVLAIATVGHAAEPIQHDAEHYILLDQHKDQWSSEDIKIDEKLAEIQKNEQRQETQYYLYPSR